MHFEDSLHYSEDSQHYSDDSWAVDSDRFAEVSVVAKLDSSIGLFQVFWTGIFVFFVFVFIES